MKKKLIFIIIKLKNLNLQEKVYFILLNMKREIITKIIKIFNYFPAAICYEITGEYYIYGLEEITKIDLKMAFLLNYIYLQLKLIVIKKLLI